MYSHSRTQFAGKVPQTEVVQLDEKHLAQALTLSLALDWPYRLEDWAFALRLGRGFAVESDDRLLGTALWWPFGSDHASAGMIIVAAEAQRQGIGGRLMEALLADAAGRTIILNSTRQGEALYTRLGFTPVGAKHQHQAVLEQAPPPYDAPLRAGGAADWTALRLLDRAGSGMDRALLLDALLAVADTMAIERDGQITGYACVRRWGRGVVIGPVIAETATDARALIAALAARHVGEFVRIDVPSASGLSAWLENIIGLPKVDQATAMVLGRAPESDRSATLYALSNQSLG